MSKDPVQDFSAAQLRKIRRKNNWAAKKKNKKQKTHVRQSKVTGWLQQKKSQEEIHEY